MIKKKTSFLVKIEKKGEKKGKKMTLKLSRDFEYNSSDNALIRLDVLNNAFISDPTLYNNSNILKCLKNLNNTLGNEQVSCKKNIKHDIDWFSSKTRICVIDDKIIYPNQTHYIFWNNVACNQEFRQSFINLLLTQNYEAFFLEFEKFDTCNPVSFRIIDATSKFKNVVQSPKEFNKYFQTNNNNNPVISFPNLSGDTTLVVPTPFSDTENVAHLKSWLDTASNSRIDTVFKYLAEKVLEEAQNNPSIYVSTHGLGVYWLHFRICSTPKYYTKT